MPKKSTLINFFYAQEVCLSLTDAKLDVDMVSLDLSKAFDVVNHKSPLAKLVALAISPAICG